jgi:hypothetical protein
MVQTGVIFTSNHARAVTNSEAYLTHLGVGYPL